MTTLSNKAGFGKVFPNTSTFPKSLSRIVRREDLIPNPFVLLGGADVGFACVAVLVLEVDTLQDGFDLDIV